MSCLDGTHRTLETKGAKFVLSKSSCFWDMVQPEVNSAGYGYGAFYPICSRQISSLHMGIFENMHAIHSRHSHLQAGGHNSAARGPDGRSKVEQVNEWVKYASIRYGIPNLCSIYDDAIQFMEPFESLGIAVLRQSEQLLQ